MIFSADSRKRGLVVTVFAILVLFAAGCSTEAEPDPSPTVASSNVSDDEAAVAAVVDKYWNAYIRSQTEPSADPAQFEGIATGVHVERTLGSARSYLESDTRRVGRPEIGDPVIEISEATATAQMCVDESTWGAEHGGTPVPPPPDAAAVAYILTVEKTEGDWVVTEVNGDETTTLKC